MDLAGPGADDCNRGRRILRHRRRGESAAPAAGGPDTLPDPLGLGLRTGPECAVIDADGWPGPHLFYVGPMLRADRWEATAAQELRVHAEQLAALLATQRERQ
jgi:uncharacterized NAD(P)/FAD-binding protein YdhS